VDALLERFAVYAGDRVPGWQPTQAPARAVVAAATPGPSTEDDPGHGNGHPAPEAQATAVSDWHPWQAAAAPTFPSTEPPWEDAPLDGDAPVNDIEDPASYVPAGPAGALTAAFAKAGGVAAVTESLNGLRERRAAGYIGWPPARLVARLRGRAAKPQAADPAAAPQAQRADIDNAITVFAGEVSGSLPEPWPRTVLAAARSRADEAQGALGAAVAAGLPPRDKVTGWWRLIALAQWLLMLLALAGLVWIALILSASHPHKPPSLLSDASLAPWLGVMVAALLLLGWLVSSWCQNMVVLAADRERELAVHAILARIGAVASDLVLIPAGRELADYERFRTELAAARAPVARTGLPRRGPQVVGSVDAGPQVLTGGDVGEVPELVRQMRLVRVAVPGGRRGPVGVGVPVKVAHEPLQPLHPGETLGGEAHLRREPPAQRPGQQPEITGYLADAGAAGQRAGGRDHGRVKRERAGQLAQQDAFHHLKRIRGRPGLE